MDDFVKTKDGWQSRYPLRISLDSPVMDVTKTCRELIDFIKYYGFPLEYNKITHFYSRRKAENFKPYWEKAFILFYIKKKSLLARLNPKHNSLEGDETITLMLNKGYPTDIKCWHEAKGTSYYGEYGEYNWKMKLETIKAIKHVLELFRSRNQPEKVEFT